MKNRYLFISIIAFLSTSCSSDYSPKPKGYFYIELPEPVYHDCVRLPFFKCSISNEALVEDAGSELPKTKGKNGTGFNLSYPRYHAKIYCTFFRMKPSDFPVLSEESRRMAYILEQNAKGITETAYSHPEQNVYGLIYEIQGNAVSPIQFVVSDSINSFFRGALYFDSSFNRDSIAPVLAYINRDIHVMLESFQWKQ